MEEVERLVNMDQLRPGVTRVVEEGLQASALETDGTPVGGLHDDGTVPRRPGGAEVGRVVNQDRVGDVSTMPPVLIDLLGRPARHPPLRFEARFRVEDHPASSRAPVLSRKARAQVIPQG